MNYTSEKRRKQINKTCKTQKGKTQLHNVNWPRKHALVSINTVNSDKLSSEQLCLDDQIKQMSCNFLALNSNLIHFFTKHS